MSQGKKIRALTSEHRRIQNAPKVLRSKAAKFTASTQLTHQTKRQIPRKYLLPITLKLLTWYLEDNLPSLLPEHFREKPLVLPLTEQGWSNNTFRVRSHSGEEYVVRMKQQEDLNDPESTKQLLWSNYHKEEWIMHNIDPMVPVAKVLSHGVGYISAPEGNKEYAYMVQSFLPSKTANTCIETQDRLKFFRQIGTIARSINRTPTKGYGNRFLQEENRFVYSSWAETIAAMKEDCQLDSLVQSHCITQAERKTVESKFSLLEALEFEPCLYHADFTNNWSNVLVNDTNEVQAIIDWELAGSGPATHFELACARYVLYRDGQDVDIQKKEFAALLEGYQISAEEFRESYRAAVEILMLYCAIGKVLRYQQLDMDSELQPYPWRLKFAERASQLVQSLSGESKYKGLDLW